MSGRADPANRPVFVAGAERSGTSLMFALLASHSRLSMVRRTNMWRWFYGKFGDLSQPENLDLAITTMSRYARLAPLDPDWDRISNEFTAGPATYGRLFALLHGHHAQAIGKPRWGDKSLHTEYFADDVFREFPDARIIHLIRDPRDRYTSISRRYDRAAKGIGAATGRWRTSVAAADRNASRYAGRYLVVRFEDLASNPAAVLEDTCGFIGEELEPAMLAMDGAPEHERGNSSFGDLEASTISTTPIGRFRNALTDQEVAFIQRAARAQMAAQGYDLESVELHGRDRWAFALGRFPITLARMTGWSARERITRSRQTVPDARLTGASARVIAPYVASSPSGLRPSDGSRIPRPPSLTYIVGTYPLLTTTFIDREIRMLRSWGVELRVISMRRPHGELSPEQATLQDDTTYVMPIAWPQVLWHNLRFAARKPRHYFSTLLAVARPPHPGWKLRLRTIGHFVLAAHVAGIIADNDWGHHLHAHFIDRAATVALVAGRLLDLPYSVTAHANDIYVRPVLLESKLAHAKFVATCTGYNQEHLTHITGEHDVNIARIYHGLGLTNYDPDPRHETEPPLLLSVGQLKEKKGFSDLLEACRELRRRGHDFRCEIIGEGPLRPLLERRIQDLGLDSHTTLRGALQHDEVIARYRAASIFVLPCVVAADGDRDGIPNVILEASAMQLPVVSTKHSGIPEAVVHEQTGLLVAPHDVAALTDALARLLDDPDAREEYGREGRRYIAARFDVDVNVKHLYEMFVS